MLKYMQKPPTHAVKKSLILQVVFDPSQDNPDLKHTSFAGGYN